MTLLERPDITRDHSGFDPKDLNQNHSAGGEIATTFTKSSPIDYFSERELVTNSGYDNQGIYHFTTPLFRSNRKSEGVHGADILPGMVEGLGIFLDTKGLKLENVEKLRFQRPIKGDLIYKISDGNPSEVDIESSIYGSFTASNGESYYFSALDTGEGSFEKHKDIILYNPLTKKLLYRDNGEISNPKSEDQQIEKKRSYRDVFKDNCRTKEEIIETHLFPLSDQDQEKYTPTLQQNVGYLLATIMDMQTFVRTLRDDNNCVVISYKNITRKKDIDRSVLFKGRCTLSLQRVGDIQKTNNGYGSASLFTLKHEDETLITGTCIVSLKQ